MAPPVFKTGLAANTVAGGFDSLPPPPLAKCLILRGFLAFGSIYRKPDRAVKFDPIRHLANGLLT